MIRWTIHGYAVISDDGMIADERGRFPDNLKHGADWERFQSELDRCVATVLGRVTHESAPNVRNRLRVVVTGSSPGLTRDASAWWWNPAKVAVSDMLVRVAPGGGRIGVPGGRTVFDLFLDHGFDEFHLTRVRGVDLPGGVRVFSAARGNISPEVVLSEKLAPGPAINLDKGIELTIWKSGRRGREPA